MSRVFFLKDFNNYYNRIVKKYNYVSEYIDASSDYAERGIIGTEIAGGIGLVNFNINDGITADITYNYVDSQEWQPDYVLVCGDNISTLNTAVPQYCFFVMEAVRTRKNQYKLTLRRDLVADNYDKILNAPMFIENATLQVNDPLIFNSEGNSYNQIKDEDEILLKDTTNLAWIVGYITAPNSESTAIISKGRLAHDIDFTTADINSWKSANLKQGIVYDPGEWSFRAVAEGENLYNYAYAYDLTCDGFSVDTTSLGRIPNTYYWRESGSAATCRSKFKAAYTSVMSTYANNYINIVDNLGTITPAQASTLLNYNNKLIHDTTSDKYYYITISSTPTASNYYNYTITSSGDSATVYTAINTLASNAFTTSSHGSDRGYRLFNSSPVQIYRYELTEVSGPYIETTVHLENNRYSLSDAPYCMFAIPYGKVNYKYDGTTYTNNDLDINLATAFGIAESLSGSGALYDLQLLPYCPKIAAWNTANDGFIDTTLLAEHADYEIIKDSTYQSALGVLLWCTDSVGTLSIPCQLNGGTTPTEIKVKNETEFYRLCSPNYNGVYQFSAAKNGGVNSIEVDYQYKPYSPYLHLNIDFNNLYGKDTNDSRGLVCAGDFSLPQTSDQWQTYEVNNKNYEKTFSRQLDNMDTMHGYDRTELIVKAVAGTVQGAASGAVAGSAGGVGGSIAGGAIGAIASGGAGVADYILAEERYNEQRSYASDLYKMNLQNVQARPDLLTKVSSLNPNNKIWPFVERYHATSNEVAYLTSQLTYNGMTVGRIGTIQEFLQPDYSFVKGRLIRLENSTEDFHNTAELAKELEKGVFIK